MGIAHIQPFAQEYADNMSDVLGLDVTILDDKGVRISGTGSYRELIGHRVPNGSFFETILQTGKPGIILETKKNGSECSSCKFIDQCTELATIGFPIFKKSEIAGVIGIIGFSLAQREIMIHDADKLISFLSHMSSLLEHKLLLLDVLQPKTNTQDPCSIHEDKQGSVPGVSFSQLLGQASSFKRVLQQAQKIVNSPSTVLLRGASGTGKELLAQAIHNESKRAAHPFVVVNCAAIPEHLLESELFGYEGGAFTGSKREGSRGKFEWAHRGTLFLDEIGDLPLSLQPKLLRALQEKKVERVGGNKQIPVDVRVIAATHRNLEKMVEEGTFRHDLYYRIHVIPLQLPSLAERKDDLPLLIRYFIHKYSTILEKEIVGLDPDLERWMCQYPWPGNIRQFENVIEYMVNMSDSVILGIDDLPPHLLEGAPADKGLECLLQEYEKKLLLQFLNQDMYRQDKSKLAQDLCISLSTLYRKIERYGL